MHIITSWFDCIEPTPPEINFAPYTNEFRQAHMAQQLIGFDLFMKGILDC